MNGPASTLGIAFGVAATVMLVLTMLYSVRRALVAVRWLGPTRGYLRLHLWSGGLFLLLFLLHAGFHVPDGILLATLWVASLWLVVTGVVGWLLQRAVPRVLESASSFEVHLQRVPELIAQLRQRAEAACERADPRVKAYYEERLAPEMAAPRMLGAGLFADPRGTRRGSGEAQMLVRTLPADGRAVLEELRALRATKHELDVHFTLQRLLRAWLYLHLPVAPIVIGLVALHVFLVLYF